MVRWIELILLIATGQKMMGKTTSNPQQYYEGESTVRIYPRSMHLCSQIP